MSKPVVRFTRLGISSYSLGQKSLKRIVESLMRRYTAYELPPWRAIINRQEPYIAVKTPFNGAFIEDLKKNINYSNRRWDPASKLWLVKIEAELNLMEVLKAHFTEIVEEEIDEVVVVWDKEIEEETIIMNQDARETALALLYLTKEAPDDVVETMVNFLLKQHPELKPQVETALLVLLDEGDK